MSRINSGFIKRIGMVVLAAILPLAPAAAAAGKNPDVSPPDVRTIAMLPMVNQSGDAQATEDVIPIIIETLKNSGIGLITPAELRPVLREHRVRAVGMIGRAGADAISSELGVDYLLIGSLDFYRTGDNPAVGFSFHLLHVPELVPFWAISVNASGNGSMGLLGLGEIDQVDTLATHLAADIAGKIHNAVTGGYPGGIDEASPLIAIVPFDDIDPDQPTGAVASTYLLTRLVHDRMRVVEPGVVRETFLKTNRSPRGEIAHNLIDILRDSLNVDLIITGAVDDFTVTAAGMGGTTADISLGARLIDAVSHRIVASKYVIKQRETGSGLLSGGSAYPPADVVMEAVKDVVSKLAISSPRAATDSR